MATRFFSASEIAALGSWPSEIRRAEVVAHFQPTADDVRWVRRSARGAPNSLGLALQLCALPWLGFVPADVRSAPPAAVTEVAARLGLGAGALTCYGRRGQTRSDHLRLVIERLGWRRAEDDGGAGWAALRRFLACRAIENDVPRELFRLATEYLAAERIVRPGVVSLMEEVATATRIAEREVFRRVEPLLTGRRLAHLEELLVVAPGMSMSRLAWLHHRPRNPASAIRVEAGKLPFLRGIGAHTLDLSMIPETRRRRLAEVGRHSRNHLMRTRRPESKYPILLATIVERYAETLDDLVRLFDQELRETENEVRAKLKQAKADFVRTYGLAVYWGPNFLDLVADRFPYLRQFAPAVLEAIEFTGSANARPLLRAVAVLRELYRRDRHDVPEDAPTAFVPYEWLPSLQAAKNEDSVRYRHIWEWSTLFGLRAALRSGDVRVPGSRRYAR